MIRDLLVNGLPAQQEFVFARPDILNLPAYLARPVTLFSLLFFSFAIPRMNQLLIQPPPATSNVQVQTNPRLLANSLPANDLPADGLLANNLPASSLPADK